jgi:hypothetical protein
VFKHFFNIAAPLALELHRCRTANCDQFLWSQGVVRRMSAQYGAAVVQGGFFLLHDNNNFVAK